MDWSWLPEWLPGSGLERAGVVLAVAVLVHLLVRGVKSALDRVIGPPGAHQPPGTGRHSKLATLLGLLFSALTFVLWFVAFGIVLDAFGINPTTYFATATVIGLAVGFGSQGLVQDLVIGLTLIFTDAMDVGDTVEISGQVGRVQDMGLRFTTLTNFLGQTVYIPNRNIAVVGRFRRGVVRAYVDVQVPVGTDPDALTGQVLALARSFRSQHSAAVMSEPEILGVRETEPDSWRFVRLKLRIWPGQQPLVETAFRQRVIAHMKSLDEKYADWMVTVSYRV